MFFFSALILSLISLVLAQNVRYNSLSGQSERDNSGRYYPDNSGQYHPDRSGAYNGNSGRYIPDGSGQYRADKNGAYSAANDLNRYRNNLQNDGNLKYTGTERVVIDPDRRTGYYNDGKFRIIKMEKQMSEDGYHYLYQTENGITAEEEGKLLNKLTNNEVLKVRGHYIYTAPNNIVYTVRYTADENGFIPKIRS